MPVGYNFDIRGEYNVQTMPIGSSQTFVVGDFLINSAGTAVIAATAGNNVAASQKLLGRALTPASYPSSAGGDLANMVQIAAPLDSTEYGVYLFNNTVGNTDWDGGTSQLGLSCGLRNVSTANGWAANSSETTDNYVKITGVNLSDADNWPRSTTPVTTQTYPRVFVKVLDAAGLTTP